MNFFKFNNYIFYTALTIILYLNIASLAYSQPAKSNVIDVNHKSQAIINSKISYYNNMYNDILFVHLKGGRS